MILSLSRIALAEKALNASAQSPAWRTNAFPSLASASDSVSERASPANTSGGTPASSLVTAARGSAGHSGCCAAAWSRQERGLQGCSGEAWVVIGLEVRPGRALAGLAAATTDLERLPAAHLLELLLGHRLLGEEGRLDPVEQPLEPADELGLRDAQLRLARRLGAERDDHVVQFGLQLGREDVVELLQGPLVDLPQGLTTRVVERRATDLVEHGAHHRGDADQLRRPQDLLVGLVRHRLRAVGDVDHLGGRWLYAHGRVRDDLGHEGRGSARHPANVTGAHPRDRQRIPGAWSGRDGRAPALGVGGPGPGDVVEAVRLGVATRLAHPALTGAA